MDEVNYIVMADGLVKYRFVLPDGEFREFDDLEQAVGFATKNEVYEIEVEFPDGDVHTIPLFGRGVFEPGHQNTSGSTNMERE